MTCLMRRPGTTGKYTVIDNRTGKVVEDAEPWGRNEFFVICLKDRYAQAALMAYAVAAAHGDDPEYSADVIELAKRAGPSSPHCKSLD
jgi:hypothetical protein